MDLDEAAAALAAPPPASSLTDLRDKVAETHSDHPQRAMLAHTALNDIETALGRLAALGHRFFLSEADPAETADFPKMVYRDGAGGLESETANDQTIFDALLADGWRDHPTAAPEAEAAAPASSTTKPSPALSTLGDR